MTIEAVRLSELPPGQPQSWLWGGYLPFGYVTLVDGLTGSGKSMLAFDWIARATVGAAWPDGQAGGEPIDVVLVTHDLHRDTIRQRLLAAGADEQRIVLIGDQLRFPQDLGELRDAVRPGPGFTPRLLIVDPLSYYVAGAGEGRTARELALLAQELQLCIVVVRHVVKSARSALDGGAGSHVIAGTSRVLFTVGRSPRDQGTGEMVIACAKNNLGPKPASRGFQVNGLNLTWTSEVDVTADGLIPSGDQPAMDEAKAFLVVELGDHEPHPSREVLDAARHTGISTSTLTKARRALGVRSDRVGGIGEAGSWYWTLPADVAT